MDAMVRLFVHLRQVLCYECYPNLPKMNWIKLADFMFMRFVMPLGWGAKSRRRRLSRMQGLIPLADEGVMRLESVGLEKVSEIRDFLNEKISHKYSGRYRSVSELEESLIELGQQREILCFSTGDLSCPLATLARSKSFIGLACDYLGRPSDQIVVEAMVDLLLPVAVEDGAYDALRFHRDIDAYKFLKIFVYLDDCSLGEGHHEYFSRSHLDFPIRLCMTRSYDFDEIQTAMPTAIIVGLHGAAGFAFAENTLGFHRATLPLSRARLMATIIYTESRFQHLYPLHFHPSI
jgi:hypothetical protein